MYANVTLVQNMITFALPKQQTDAESLCATLTSFTELVRVQALSGGTLVVQIIQLLEENISPGQAR